MAYPAPPFLRSLPDLAGLLDSCFRIPFLLFPLFLSLPQPFLHTPFIWVPFLPRARRPNSIYKLTCVRLLSLRSCTFRPCACSAHFSNRPFVLFRIFHSGFHSISIAFTPTHLRDLRIALSVPPDGFPFCYGVLVSWFWVFCRSPFTTPSLRPIRTFSEFFRTALRFRTWCITLWYSRTIFGHHHLLGYF